MTALNVMVILALLATIVALGWGIGSMAHGGVYDVKHSHQFMEARLGFQALAIILIMIALIVSML
ncbi:MAG: twin transmembrane helix small protein [Gammaproteobacteria bacterium]|nr:twin transmembrane helix small protein [Gammaproteobacteria bacterium]MDH5653511.1 twin transmembrane helix small protein [Gammaproteobacteria bacterium]